MFFVSFSASFDREEKDEYTFSLIVSDNGRNPRQSLPATVTITITNLNDESPEFDPASYSKCLALRVANARQVHINCAVPHIISHKRLNN